ncbi:hypothetical protein ACLKA6_007342 [Drosophila palustris]
MTKALALKALDSSFFFFVVPGLQLLGIYCEKLSTRIFPATQSQRTSSRQDLLQYSHPKGVQSTGTCSIGQPIFRA